MGDFLTIDLPEARIAAYRARPARVDAPALLLLSDRRGMDAGLRACCEAGASWGYLTVGPALPCLQPARARRAAIDLDQGVNDTLGLVHELRRLAGGPRPLGLLGLGLGGLLAYRAACTGEVDAAVVVEGRGLQDHLDDARRARTPMQLHLAADDPQLPPDTLDYLQAELGRLPPVELHLHAGCRPGFVAQPRDARERRAAARVDALVRAFLAAQLG